MKYSKTIWLASILFLFSVPNPGHAGTGAHIAAELLMLGVDQLTAATMCCSASCQQTEQGKVSRLEWALRFEQGKAASAQSDSARSFHQSVVAVLQNRINAIKGGRVFQGKAIRFNCI